MNNLFQSTGILRYSFPVLGETNPLSYRLVVEVDQQIAEYYRSLVPKHITLLRQKYPAHISVVRKEIPPNLDVWGKYHGQKVDFFYDPYINFGKIYCWLNVFSRQLEQIRVELGVPMYNDINKPPDKKSCYHMTIGNFKYMLED